MSGHSKWAQIKRQKAVVDAKRSSVFTRLARAIFIAARDGADPTANHALQLAIDRALAANMPKDNIKRAIERAQQAQASGSAGLLEAYGPGGVALLIEIVTDNRNRTIAEIRHLLSVAGGSLGGSGSVTWQFARQGHIWQPKQTLEVAAEAKEQLSELLTQLHAHDDVVQVISNAANLEPDPTE